VAEAKHAGGGKEGGKQASNGGRKGGRERGRAYLDVEVVVGAVNVGGDDGGEVAAVLLLVAPRHHVKHALGIGVPLIGRMRRPIMNHALINRVRRLIREHTRRQAGHQLLHLEVLARLHDIIVDQNILPVELHFLLHVAKQPPHQGRQVNDHRRAVLLKNSVRLRLVTQVPVLGAQKHVGLGVGGDGV